MTALLIGILIGLVLAKLYRVAGRVILGDEKFAQMAARKLDHDTLENAYQVFRQERVRRGLP